jgi:hypothetical protein
LQASLTPEFTRMTWGDIPGKVPEGIEVDGQRITAEFVVAPAQNRRVEVDDHLTVLAPDFSWSLLAAAAWLPHPQLLVPISTPHGHFFRAAAAAHCPGGQ